MRKEVEPAHDLCWLNLFSHVWLSPLPSLSCNATLRVGEALSTSPASATNNSLRVDETEVTVKGVWMYLYRAVDSQGNTLEFYLSVTRDPQAARRFFVKALGASHSTGCATRCTSC